MPLPPDIPFYLERINGSRDCCLPHIQLLSQLFLPQLITASKKQKKQVSFSSGQIQWFQLMGNNLPSSPQDSFHTQPNISDQQHMTAPHRTTITTISKESCLVNNFV